MDSVLTVVTAASSRDLTTLATVREELGITSDATDPLLRRWIRETSALIEAYTQRVFIREALAETFRHARFHDPFRMASLGYRTLPVPEQPLRLARYPIHAVTSVIEDDGAGLAAETDYEIVARDGVLFRLVDGRHVSWSAQTTVVHYSAGFALGETDLAPVEQACVALVRHRWFNRDRDPSLRQINIPGVVEKTWWIGGAGEGNVMPPEIAATLDLFREVRA